MAVVLSPAPKQYFWNITTGEPLNGGYVYTYAAGTTTPLTTYQDSGGSVANQNPIVLNSAGFATIYLTSGLSYKFVVTDGSAPYPPVATDIVGVTQWSQDNITAPPAFPIQTGTWTPQLLSDQSGTAGGYTGQSGMWINIYGLVLAQFYINLSDKGTLQPNANLILGTFPFGLISGFHSFNFVGWNGTTIGGGVQSLAVELNSPAYNEGYLRPAFNNTAMMENALRVQDIGVPFELSGTLIYRTPYP